jgi:hypothetical protein
MNFLAIVRHHKPTVRFAVLPRIYHGGKPSMASQNRSLPCKVPEWRKLKLPKVSSGGFSEAFLGAGYHEINFTSLESHNGCLVGGNSIDPLRKMDVFAPHNHHN